MVEREVVITLDGVEVPRNSERFGELFAQWAPLMGESACVEAGVRFGTREVAVERDAPVYRMFQILLPVREGLWEGHHSDTNPGHLVATPTREITDRVGLVGQPQSFDLFEPDGRRASITVASGDRWHTYQSLTYLRRDLLDRYLSEASQVLVWAIWGERGVAGQSKAEHLPAAQIETTYRVFSDIRRYVPQRR
jgi:hypothetical protein